MTVISVIVGSTRKSRFSEKPAHWILRHLKKRNGVDARLLDLRDFPMPFFDQAVTPATPGRPALQERGRSEMDRRDRAVRRLHLRHPGIQLRPLRGAQERDRLGLSRVASQGGLLRELWLRHGRTQRSAASPNGDRDSARPDSLVGPHPCRHSDGSLPGRRCRRWTGRAGGARRGNDRRSAVVDRSLKDGAQRAQRACSRHRSPLMTTTLEKVLYTGKAPHHGWPGRRVTQP